MNQLRATLFQSLCVTDENGRPLDLGSPTSRSLLAYLLLHRHQPENRRRLAFLLWPRATESAARRNLRQYLHHIRLAIEDPNAEEPLLLADGSTIQLNPRTAVWIDVEAFRHGLRLEATLPEMQNALGLYTGELIEDVYDDWCEDERQTLHTMYLKGLERVSLALQASGRLDDAVTYAQRWANAEPLDEAAHRRVMTLYAVSGDRNRAIQQYRSLIETLRQELQADPLPETQALFQSIQAGSLPPDRPAAPFMITAPVAPSPRVTSPPPLPLVGRQTELAQLQAMLERARNGEGKFILITGESGIGKTRLVQEYLLQHPNLSALRGICHELEWVAPYTPLRAMLQPVPELLPELHQSPPPAWLHPLISIIPSLSQRFPYLVNESTNPSELHMADALGHLIIHLAECANPNPLHLILDDLHWADVPTWEFLARLARHATSAPLIVLGLCRLEDLSAERHRLIRTLERNDVMLHLALQRLTPDETVSLAEYLLSRSDRLHADPLFMHRLYQETEGNPFFVIETVRAARELGRLPYRSNVNGSIARSLPQGIQRVIEARLDRLSPPSRELLATAAAIGRGFQFSMLNDIGQAGDAETVRFIEEWLQRGLVHEDLTGYDFSHDKLREVAYVSLSRARREYVHRRIAEALIHSGPPADAATLAHHYAHSDQPLKALPYLIEAGEQSLRARSYHEARQFGLQAVNLLSRSAGSPIGPQPDPSALRVRIDLNLQLAQAYAFSDDLNRAQEILGETEHLALTLGDEARLANVFYRSSQIFWLRGQPTVAGDYARRLLRAAEELNDSRLLNAALRMLGRVGIALSTFDDAIAYLLRYTKEPRPDLSIVLGYLGIAYDRVGAWARALDAARRGLDLAEAAGGSEAIAFARMQLGFVHADYHEWQSCLDALEHAPDPLTQDEGMTPLGFMVLGLRGRALGYLGQPQLGLQTIRPALEWAERIDYRVFHYLPRLFLAECLLLAGDANNAHLEAEKAVEQATVANSRWAIALGRRVAAEALIRLPNPNWPRIEDHLIAAMRLLRETRARPELARTYLALRRLYDRAGQIAWAVDCHFRATSIFDELGMTEELRQAQGQAAGDRRGAVVIPNLQLRGPLSD